MPTITVSERIMSRIRDRAIPFEDDEPEDVIRRLLDETEEKSEDGESEAGSSADLVTRGGIVPHGTELRATYKGTEYHAKVEDGAVVWNGRRFDSLSKAAVAVIRSTGTDRSTESGWRFWDVKTPDSDYWRPARDLQSDEDETLSKEIHDLKQNLALLTEEQKQELRESLDLDDEDDSLSQSDKSDSDSSEGVEVISLICEGRDVRAVGEYHLGTGKLVVMQGAEAAPDTTDAADRAKEIRESLEEKGALRRENGSMIFKRDQSFSSPSSAARAVLGRSANGWTEWVSEDGRTLDEIVRK